MLKKLLKYDFHASTKIFTILYSIVILLSIIAKIVISIIPEGRFSTSLMIVLVPTYILFIIGLIVASQIFLIVRFYKNLFTDEGYLIHTLPVKPWQLITSKLITSVVLCFAGLIIVCLCGLLLISGDIFTTFVQALPEVIAEIENFIGIPIIPAVLLFTLLMIIGEINGYLLFFAAIAFGQVLIPKHKILGAFAAYMIFYMALQTVTFIPTFAYTFSQMPMLLSAADEMIFVTRFYHFTYFLSIGLCIISSIVFFFITNLIMKKKLNLD